MRIHRRGDAMGAACRGGGAKSGVFSRVEPTGRRSDAGYVFGVLRRDCVVVTGNDRDDRTLPGGGEGTGNRAVDASVSVLCICGTLTPLPSKVPPYTSPSQLVIMATPFTPISESRIPSWYKQPTCSSRQRSPL